MEVIDKSSSEIVDSKEAAPESGTSIITDIKESETAKEPVKEAVKLSNLDVCFMLDCTGSMQSYIDRARNKIKDIIEEVKQQHPESEIQVGIVGYRDITDTNRFEILPFTSNIQSARDFLDAIKADGGNDTPEDVNGAFQQVLNKMEWQGQAKMIVHVADAPCHGKEFHSTHDNYPDGYKDDVAWDVIFKQIIDQRMDYLFLKIQPRETDKMFDKFKEIAEKQGASAQGVLFKQEAITNIEQAAPTTSLFTTPPLFKPLFAAAPAARKRASRREVSKKEKPAPKAKKASMSRSASRKKSPSKSPSRASRAKSSKKVSSKKESSDEEEEDHEEGEEDESSIKPRYLTRSKFREWQENQEKGKRKASRGRKTSKKRSGNDDGGSYWTIPEYDLVAEKEIKKTPKKKTIRKTSASKEKDRNESRDNKKREKSSSVKASKSKSKKTTPEKVSPKKKVAPAPKKKVTKKDTPKSTPSSFAPSSMEMSALDEQEYFAKLLSKEMTESINRKKDLKFL